MKYTIFLLCCYAFFSCQKTSETPVVPETGSTVTYKDTTFTNMFRRTTGWIAGDVASSLNLKNGKSLWVFGDSYIDHYDPVTKTVPCLFQVSNAALTMDIGNPNNQQTFLGSGVNQTLFTVGKSSKYVLWPGTGYVWKDTAYIFQDRIHLAGTGMWAFKVIDSLYVAKVYIPTMKVAGYAQLGSRNKISFVHSIIYEPDSGYHYIYGIRDNGFGRDLFLARFTAQHLHAPWQYYVGNKRWSTDIQLAQKIHSEFTASFDVCKINGKYVLLTTAFSVDCNQGKHIFAYTSNEPFGPFEEKKEIWKVDDLLQGHTPFFYQAEAHPEYNNGKKELLVTYCINGYGSCVNTCVNGRFNPDYYRPKAIRVPYSILGL